MGNLKRSLQGLSPRLVLAAIVMALAMVVAGGGVANALTQTDCRTCHTGSATGSMTDRHHTLITTKGYNCDRCHAVTYLPGGGFLMGEIQHDCVVCHGQEGHLLQHDKAQIAPECIQCHGAGVVQEHLNRTSTCSTCHSSTRQAVVDAIAAGKAGTVVTCVNCHGSANHLAQHDKFSTATECALCHSMGPIQEHINRGSSCQTCHGSADATVQATIAAGKAGTPVNCLNCHTINHVKKHVNASTAPDCAQCHTQGVLPEHLTRRSDCFTCHNSTKPEVQNTIAAGVAGTQVNCNNCHIAVNHTAQHDMVSTAASCLQCHTLGALPEHLNRTSTCATCHNSAKPEVISTIAAGRAGTAVNCENCHGASNHLAQHDKVSAAADCAACHGLGVVQEHLSRKSTCATCHNSARPEVLAAITAGRAGTPVNCLNCHASVNHVAQHDMVSTAANCGQCHNLGVLPEHLNRTSNCQTCHSSTNPSVVSTIAAGRAGTAVNCANCHGGDKHVTQHDKVSVAVDCAQCHTLGVLPEHLTRKSTCVTCHSSAKPEVLAAITAGKAGTAVTCVNCHGSVNHIAQHDKASVAAECASCHKLGVVQEHLSRKSTCQTCHGSASSQVQATIAAGRAGTAVNCVNCHGQYNHPNAHVGKVAAPYNDCNSCHITNLVDLHAQKGFQCATCHSSSNTAVSAAIQKGLGGQPVVCSDCHNSINGFGNHAGQHDRITLSTANSFIAEHEAKAIYCFTCHNKAAYQTAINNGMAGVQQNCGSCHAPYGNLPPVANAGPDQVVAPGKAVTLSGAASTDPDGSITSYAWNFGDGTTGSGVSVSKTYSVAGVYTVSLTVTDANGASSTDTAIITVQAPTNTTVFADQGLALASLSSATSAEGSSKTDVTTKLKDNNLTDLISVSRGTSYSVVAMKLNRDALTATKVTLRIYVSSISSTQSLRVYPYKSDGLNVDSTVSASASATVKGWVDIDVTSIAQKMNGYGWMKFRVANTTSSMSISEGSFILQ